VVLTDCDASKASQCGFAVSHSRPRAWVTQKCLHHATGANLSVQATRAALTPPPMLTYVPSRVTDLSCALRTHSHCPTSPRAGHTCATLLVAPHAPYTAPNVVTSTPMQSRTFENGQQWQHGRKRQDMLARGAASCCCRTTLPVPALLPTVRVIVIDDRQRAGGVTTARAGARGHTCWHPPSGCDKQSGVSKQPAALLGGELGSAPPHTCLRGKAAAA
jgi:hypothetical protein